SSASRATMDSSATRGQPRRPSCAAVAPSWATAPSVKRGSSACCAISTSKPLAYSNARRISCGSATHLPSSENMRTLASERHHAKFCEVFAFETFSNRPYWVNIAYPQALGFGPYRLGDDGLVHHGWGMSHGKDRGKPAFGRSLRAGLNRSRISTARSGRGRAHIKHGGK